jgi:hypothetical protein
MSKIEKWLLWLFGHISLLNVYFYVYKALQDVYTHNVDVYLNIFIYIILGHPCQNYSQINLTK